MWVDDQIGSACIFIGKKGQFPGFAAIGGFVNSTFFVGAVQVAQHGHPGGIGVGGVQNDAADVVAFFQPQVLPGFAAIGAFVHSRTGVRGATGVIFPSAQPDDVVFPVDGYISDGHHGFFIKKRLKTDAVVGSFPKAARSKGCVEMAGVVLPNVYINDAPAVYSWADVAKLDAIDQRIGF